MCESEDAWEKSRELIKEGEPYLNSDIPPLGMFRVVWEGDPSLGFAKGEGGVETYINFRSTRSARNFYGLSVWTPEGIYSLFQDQIQFEDLLSRTRAFPNVPNFTFQWKKKIFPWDVDGGLKFVRVDLQGGLADFSIGPDGRILTSRQDPEGIFDGLPSDLNELAHTFHRSLDWTVDYPQRSQQILQLSNLEEFIGLLKAGADA